MENSRLKFIGRSIKQTVTAGVLLVILGSLLLSFSGQSMLVSGDDFAIWSGIETVWLKVLLFFGCLWLFFLGACFASFLNVVAWRLPQKMTVLGKSHCPSCGATLSLRENMPIIGWLERGGVSKCCGLPIPSRYFLVEFLLGVIFLTIGLVELGFAGVNLPAWLRESTWPYRDGFINPVAALLVLGHLTLASLLFTFALFRFEGDQVPYSVFTTGGIIAFLILFLRHFLSGVMPECNAPFIASLSPPVLVLVVTVLIRLAIGILFGLVLIGIEALMIGIPASEVSRHMIFATALIGMLLGVQGLLIAAVHFVLLSVALRAAGQYGSSSGWMDPAPRLLIAMLLTIFTWRAVGDWLQSAIVNV